MYRHILIPTDGSELSARAIVAGVELARCMNAKVTGFFSMPQYMPPYLAEAAMIAPGAMESVFSQENFEKQTQELADKALAVIQREADKAGVAAALSTERNDFPATAILKKIEELGCDAVVMASHGRRGLQSLLLGSETMKVLTQSKIPILVVR